MTKAKDSDFTGDSGVGLVRFRVGYDLRWIFRDKPTMDYGIDGEVEVIDAGEPAGRFVLLQIKTGPSYLREADEAGWTYRPDNAHVAYWRRNVLPVCVVLVDPDTEQAYWQVVDDDTLRNTGKGWALHVPRSQTIRTARDAWSQLAELTDQRAEMEYPHNLQVLPPSAAEALDRDRTSRPAATARLAQRLAAARSEPAEVCKSLLGEAPTWLTPALWRAVASYAAEHDLPEAASEALLLAAAGDPDARGRLTAAAGLYRLANSAAAGALLERAASLPGGEVLVEIGRHLLEFPTGPLPDLLSVPAEEGDAAAAAAYRREQATRADDLSGAIRHAEQACQLAPTYTSYRLALATLLTRRSGRAGAGRDDLGAAERLARAVLGDRRAWSGPMVEPTVLALQCALLADRVAEALALGTAAPDGTADPTVATDPEVLRLTARAWTRLGRPDRARELAAAMPEGLARARALADLPPQEGEPEASDEQQAAAWQDVLDRAVEAADHETVMAAAARLADLGRSSAAPLAALVADGRVSPDTVRLVEAVAAAHRDPQRGMPALRALALHDVTAAETAVITLARTGQYEQAADLAAQAYGRLRAPTLLPLRMDVLADGGLREQAVQAARDALDDERVQGPLRASCYRLLASDAGEDQRWPQAETLFEQALTAGAGRYADADAWSLIRCQLNQRAEDRALHTLRERAPGVRGEDDVRTWLRVHATHPWTDDDVREALALARRFAGKAALSAALLSATVAATSDEQLRGQVVAEISRHVARHSDAGGIKVMGGSDEQFRADLTAVLQQQAALPAQLAPRVSAGELPFGMLASALHRSYSLLLAEPAAVLCAGAVDENVYDTELAAARAAVGRRVVVCLDALHVSCLLDLTTTILSHFSDVALTNRARDDALQGVVEARALNGGSSQLAWSDRDGTIVLLSRDDHDVQLLRQHVAAIDTAAGQCSLEPTPPTSTVPTLTPERDGAWVSGLDLASSTGRPLWSDDRVLRAIAMQVGVPTFGTLALLEALGPTLMDEEAVLTRLLASHIGDLPVPVDVLLEQARADGWQPGAAATALARPSWWAWAPDPAGPLLSIFEACRRQAPAAVPAWRATAMRGLGRLLRGDPEAASRLLCRLASLGLTLEDDEPAGTAGLQRVAEQVAQGVHDAQQVAEALGLPDPIRYLPEVIADLAADLHLPDPAGLLTDVQAMAGLVDQQAPNAAGDEHGKKTDDSGSDGWD